MYLANIHLHVFLKFYYHEDAYIFNWLLKLKSVFTLYLTFYYMIGGLVLILLCETNQSAYSADLV